MPKPFRTIISEANSPYMARLKFDVHSDIADNLVKKHEEPDWGPGEKGLMLRRIKKHIKAMKAAQKISGETSH